MIRSNYSYSLLVEGRGKVKGKNKRPRRSSEVMKDFLSDVLEKREAATERRHQEKMEAVNSLVDVLKDALKKK